MKYQLLAELPPLANEYGKPYLVCLVKNVHWVYVFWEITAELLETAWQKIGYDENARKILRVLKGKQPEQQIIFEMALDPNVGFQYLFLPDPGHLYQMEILLAGDSRAVVLLSSNMIITPFDGVSAVEDELWLSIDELYQGFAARLSQSGLTSPLHWGVTSPVIKPIIKDELDFIVETELILYGRATPGATVYVQGEPISTSPDGSFTLRYALPEGCFIYPLKAVAPNGNTIKTIVPVITRETY